MKKQMYGLLGLVTSVVVGSITESACRKAWARAGDTDEPPQATSSPDYGGSRALLAAALQGAIYGVVKSVAAVVAARRASVPTGRSRTS